MNIGQKIKELRQENNLTQEELAEQLGVSFQAVSRWENSITFPDITMLPIIANMFDVTTDYLLDIDTYKMKEEIDKIIEYDDLMFHEGKTKDREKILENALKKYPNSWKIKDRLMCVYFTIAFSNSDYREEYDQKTIKIATNILDKCVEDSIRYGAMQTLVLTYQARKEYDKAKSIAEKLPDMIITRDWLWPDVVTGVERIKATQEIFSNLVELFYSKLITTYGRAETGKRDIPLLKYKAFLDIVYENGDYGFQHNRLSDIYMRCAKDQAVINNKEKTLEYIKKSYFHINEFVNMYINKEVLKNTSFLVDRLEDNPRKWYFSSDIKEQYKEFLEELKIEVFDFLSNDGDFNQIVEALNKEINS